MKTAIKVINLETSQDRRTSFEHSAADAICEWSFFNAYKALSLPLKYNPDDCVQSFGRELSRAEIGCYVSHFKCWQWLLQSEYDQMIVLEDDVVVDWIALHAISGFDFSNSDLHLVKLFASHPVNADMVRYRFLSQHHHLVRSRGMALGTQAYVITRKAAATLVAKFDKIERPVDWVLARYWDHQIVNYVVLPHPVLEKMVPSTLKIEATLKKRSGGISKIKSKSIAIREKFARSIFQYKYKSPISLGNDTGESFVSSS